MPKNLPNKCSTVRFHDWREQNPAACKSLYSYSSNCGTKKTALINLLVTKVSFFWQTLFSRPGRETLKAARLLLITTIKIHVSDQLAASFSVHSQLSNKESTCALARPPTCSRLFEGVLSQSPPVLITACVGQPVELEGRPFQITSVKHERLNESY